MDREQERNNQATADYLARAQALGIKPASNIVASSKPVGAVNAQGQIIGAGGTVLGNAPAADIPRTITSEDLVATPLGSVPPANNFGLSGAESIASANATVARNNQIADQEAKIEQARTGTQDVISDIEKQFGLVADAQTQALKADEAIDPWREEAAKLNTQIADMTVEYRGVQDAIKARGDISREAQQGLLLNAEERYGRALADLSIRQAAANQNIEQMEKSADRKLEMTIAPIQTKIDFLTKVKLDASYQWTDDEKEKLDRLITEREQERDAETERQKGITNIITTALENGVKIPDSVVRKMMAAGSTLEASQILNAAGISLAKPTVAKADKPLDILDIARYNELYPDAGVVAGDTQDIANKKVALSNTPEAKLTNQIQAFVNTGATYDETIKEINDSVSITNKPLAIQIAQKLFGINENEVEQTKTKQSDRVSVGNTPRATIPGEGIILGISNFFENLIK